MLKQDEIEFKLTVAQSLEDYLLILNELNTNTAAKADISLGDFKFDLSNPQLFEMFKEFLKTEISNRIKELETNYFITKKQL